MIRYPKYESRDLFGVLDILAHKNGLNQKTVDNSKWLKKYKESLFKIMPRKSDLCTILEIDEDSNESDSEFDDEVESMESDPNQHLRFNIDHVAITLFFKLSRSIRYLQYSVP